MRTPLIRPIRFSPSQVLVFGFAGLILVGAILLTLPAATRDGRGLPIIDALFEATTAVCVTGLIVVDTATVFTGFGQAVMLVLIQFGGLGIMTLATMIFLFLGKRISLRERLVMQAALNVFTIEGVVRLTRYVILVSLAIEAFGAALLSFRFVPQFGFARGVWMSVFHSISAFCNAGIDIIGGFKSLTAYVGDPLVVLTIAGLIILGGIGFTVVAEVYQHRSFAKLPLHSKLALTVTGTLLAVGTLVIFLLERTNPATLGSLPWGSKLLASFFQAVTPRTAGFNTLTIADMTESSLVFTIILMFIGASPSSTGGGIKTTTFAVLVMAVIAVSRGSGEVTAFRRRLPATTVYRALAITAMALGLVIMVAMVLTRTEQFSSFLPLLYETTSAFGTVGLSTGLTPQLSVAGKLLIIMTMFIGRVGPLTLTSALAERAGRPPLHHPEDRVMVG
jgi:trk system potassium uptake protein TrkH